MLQHTIQPLGSYILFKIVDLYAPSSVLVMPEGVSGQQAAAVLGVGPEVKGDIHKGDLLILAEGVTFPGYKLTDNVVVHLIPEGCIVGKFIEATTVIS